MIPLTLLPMILKALQAKHSAFVVVGTAITASLMCCRLAAPLLDMIERLINRI